MFSVKRSITVLCTVGFLKNMLFILPVLMLYYGYKGVGIGDFFLIQGFSSMMVFLCEVPSGYVGDLFSRKRVIISGFIVWTLGYLFWIFGSGFWFILAGELLFGISMSMISGTLEAYMYDLLKKQRKEKAFHKKFAKYNMVQDVGLLLATLVGGVAYNKLGGDATVWLCVATMIMAIILMMFMPDVKEYRRIVKDDKNKFRDILDISINALKKFDIRWLISFSSIYGVLTFVLMWGLQAVMINRDIPVYLFGMVFAVNSLVRVCWGYGSAKLLDKFGLKIVIGVLVGIICVATSGAVISLFVPYAMVYVCLGAMIIGSGSVVLARVVTGTLINHRIESDERATVLSVKHMIEKTLAGVGMMFLKPLFDNIGVGETYMLCMLLIIPIVFCAKVLRKISVGIE